MVEFAARQVSADVAVFRDCAEAEPDTKRRSAIAALMTPIFRHHRISALI